MSARGGVILPQLQGVVLHSARGDVPRRGGVTFLSRSGGVTLLATRGRVALLSVTGDVTHP